jgi:hypothetical protein
MRCFSIALSSGSLHFWPCLELIAKLCFFVASMDYRQRARLSYHSWASMDGSRGFLCGIIELLVF